MVAYKTKTREQIDVEIDINCKHGEFTFHNSIMDKQKIMERTEQLSFVKLQLLTSTKKSLGIVHYSLRA